MVKIVDRQVEGLPVIEWAKGKPTCIVAHETANDDNKGSYEGEIEYMKSNYKNAFYHMIAGEKNVALLHDPKKGGAWGSGPKMHAYAIHIELARSSTKAGFKKAYNNWIGAIKHYAKKYGIPIVVNKGSDKTGIYTHHYVTKTFGGTTHTDPDAYLKKYGVSINQFAKDVGDSKGASETDSGGGSVSVSSATKWKKVTGNWTGQTLFPGDYGKPVEQMQQALADNNPPFYPEKSAKNNGIDEYYGGKTENAVTRIQEYYGLDKDGLAGKEVYNQVKGKVKTTSNKSSGQGKGTVHLPKSAGTWKTYTLDVQPVAKNSKWSLAPGNYKNGLTYDILGEPYKDVVTIKTSKGKRNIFVGGSTSAVVKK